MLNPNIEVIGTLKKGSGGLRYRVEVYRGFVIYGPAIGPQGALYGSFRK